MVSARFDRTIRLGLMAPLTGLVAIYGAEIVRAAEIARDEINEMGGLLGLPLELVIEDDGSLPSTAVPAAFRLTDEHRCHAIIGNLLSNSRISVANRVAATRRIPMLNFSFYEGSISGRYFFHFAALPNQQIDLMMPYMTERFGAKIFFAGSNYEWPRGSIDAAKRALRKIHGDIVGEDYLPIGAERTEIDDLLRRVAKSGADIFVPYFAGADQIVLLTRFAEQGLKKHMAVMMAHFDEVISSHLAPEVRNGFYSGNTYFMSVDTPENRKYFERLALRPDVHGIWPNGDGALTNFGEGVYLCVKAFAQAVISAGTADVEKLVDALEHADVSSPQGRVIMDPATHHAHVNTYLARCRLDGSFSIVKSFGRNPPVIPIRYRDQPPALELYDMQSVSIASPTRAQGAPLTASFSDAAARILHVLDMALVATDTNGLIIRVNPGACDLFGYDAAEMIGMSVHALAPPHLRKRHAAAFKQFVQGPPTERAMNMLGAVKGYRKDGSFVDIEASIAKIRDGDNWIMVATIRDITEVKKAEDELTWQATHDQLTGLPNRGLIHQRLTNALLRSVRGGRNVALLFVDLDDFKAVNDTLGHFLGDALLKAVALRLINVVRPGDTVGRPAGDEFIIICENIQDPCDLEGLAERVNEAVRKPFELTDVSLFMTASVGVAVGHGTTHSPDDMIRCADMAMYAVKQKGRDGRQFFSEDLQEQAVQRRKIINGLRVALELNEFSCRYQPIVSTADGRIVGAELLLRWRSHEGEISPAVFIPVAEAMGAIIPIGAWVFREGCRAESEWRRRWGSASPYVSINISARQLAETGLLDDLTSTMREFGTDPSRIVLEITETSLMGDAETSLLALRRLSEVGLKLAVDDFGTGYSSLWQLARLPVNVLKIDRAFIDGVDEKAENRLLVKAIVSLGRALNLGLVAEGVETSGQSAELASLGCDHAQGYFYHPPLMPDEFMEIYDRQVRSSN